MLGADVSIVKTNERKGPWHHLIRVLSGTLGPQCLG